MTDRSKMKIIGSSQIGAVLGLDPFTTPLKLWGILTETIEPDDLSQNEAVEWGKRHEPLIAEAFAEKNGVKLMAYKKRFYHEKYPFLSCELDRIIVGTDEIVEIKTASHHMAKQWEAPDQVPPHYVCQVMFALGLSGRNVGHVAVLIGGNQYLQKKIIFDQEFYNDLVEKAVAFWHLVETKQQPMAVGADNPLMVEIYPEGNEQLQQVEELNAKIAHLQELKMHIGELENQQAEIEAQLKQVIGESAGIQTSEYVAKWTPQKTMRLDQQRLKMEDLHTYEKFQKESLSRVLRISKVKVSK